MALLGAAIAARQAFAHAHFASLLASREAVRPLQGVVE